MDVRHAGCSSNSQQHRRPAWSTTLGKNACWQVIRGEHHGTILGAGDLCESNYLSLAF